MPLAAADLLEPQGELASDLLAGWSDATRRADDLAAYLDEGYDRAADAAAEQQDEAARQWAYRRAYRAKFREVNQEPSTTAVGGSDAVTTSFLVTQIKYWRDLADEAEAAYLAIPGVVPLVTEPVVPSAPPAPVSRSTPLTFAW